MGVFGHPFPECLMFCAFWFGGPTSLPRRFSWAIGAQAGNAALDGGLHVDMTDVSLKTYGNGLSTDGREAKSFQSTARRIASLFPCRPSGPLSPPSLATVCPHNMAIDTILSSEPSCPSG